MLRLTLFSLLISATLFAQTEHKISKVTVYPNGAQVERTANVKLEKGSNAFFFDNLSPNVNGNSIRLFSSNGKIGNVEFYIDYLNKPKAKGRIKELEDSLDVLNVQIQTKQNKITALNMELELIRENKNIKGQAVLDIADMEDFLLYYRQKIPEIQNSILVAGIQLEQHKELKNKINRQLNELRGRQRKQMGVIKVSVGANSAQNTKLEISYSVRGAGWSPNYNIRANQSEGPITIEYNAQVYQNTGIDWNEVPLVLATGNPNYNSTLPDLQPQFLYNQPQRKYKREKQISETRAYAEENVEIKVAGLAKSEDDVFEPNEQLQLLTYSAFKINAPYVIPSNGKQVQINVDNYTLNSEYQYFSVPKLSNKVFLTALVTGYEELGLLPGPSKIYFDNTFVGSAQFDPIQTTDTMEVSLGYDPNIIIEREKEKEVQGKKLFGGRKTVERAFTINIKNSKSSSISLVIKDQIPMSRDEEIKIEEVELGGGKLSENKGEIEWEIKLHPGEQKEIKFRYQVSYPKKYIVNL